ncbi:unnamed protein product [Sphagnum jensenii]|uniref:Uncharacterized protein n=1 Tax=Sphagnum jensenii TaxID=128206 RepID=A0ABP1A653_9BRYO
MVSDPMSMLWWSIWRMSIRCRCYGGQFGKCRSDANVVVVNLADVGRVALAHKRKHARGQFPWAHTHGWTEGDPLT